MTSEPDASATRTPSSLSQPSMPVRMTGFKLKLNVPPSPVPGPSTSSIQPSASSESAIVPLPASPLAVRPQSPKRKAKLVHTQSDDELLGPEGEESIEAEDMPLMVCEWQDCGAMYWEVEEFIEHIGRAHVDHCAKTKWGCEWSGCSRKDKPQGSRFALVTHLRSHTGEKPFTCPKPECDKTFTRADAMQKHLRVQHAEHLPVQKRNTHRKRMSTKDPLGDGDSAAGDAPPAKKGRRGKAAAAQQDDEDDDDGEGGDTEMSFADTGQAEAAATAASKLEEKEDPLLLEALQRNPGQSPAYLRYVVQLAKCRFVGDEYKDLLEELQELEKTESRLKNEKEEILKLIYVRELGDDVAMLYREIDETTIARTPWSYKSRTSLLPPEREFVAM